MVAYAENQGAIGETAMEHYISNPRPPRPPRDKYAYSNELDADALNPLADVTDAACPPTSAVASAL